MADQKAEGEAAKIVKDPTGVTVAEKISFHRDDKNISRPDLAKMLKDAGVDLTAHAIGRIERRQRKVELGELSAIAAALEVSVVELLTPTETTSPFGVTLTGLPTDMPLEPMDIQAWLKGETGISPIELYEYWRSLSASKRNEAEVLERAYNRLEDGEALSSETFAQARRDLERTKRLAVEAARRALEIEKTEAFQEFRFLY